MEEASRYELLRLVANGGMGEVFLARTEGAHGFEKSLAIKRILPKYAADPLFRERFVAEAKLAASLSHANIVQVFDFGHLGESLYIAMEYVDGVPISRIIRWHHDSGEQIPIDAVFHMVLELCKGLTFAHERGVVHRDISPANVLVSVAGETKIVDFGIARASDRTSLFGPGAIVGKMGYLSPEQSLSGDVTSSSDLYSAGVVLYEMLTATKLYGGNNFEKVLEAIRASDVKAPSTIRPGLPRGLDEIVLHCLRPEPADRFVSAAALSRALTEVCYAERIFPSATALADVVALVRENQEDTGVDLNARLQDELRAQGVAMEITKQTAITKALRTPSPALRTPTAKQFGSDTSKTFVQTKSLLLPDIKASPLESVVPETAAEPEEQRSEVVSVQANSAEILPVQPTLAAAGKLGTMRVLVAAIALGAAVVFIWNLPDRETASTKPGASESQAKSNHATPLPVADHGRDLEVVSDASSPAAASVDAASARSAIASLASLQITTDPEGATVEVDGIGLGRTPLEREIAANPRARLKLRLRGFVSYQQTIELRAGKQTSVSHGMRPKKKLYGIDVYSTPWADIYLNRRKVGEAPVRGLRLPRGHHRLRLKNPVSQMGAWLEVDVPSKKKYRVRLKRL